MTIRFLQHLSNRLEQRGIATHDHHKTGFSVAGIDKALESEFSQRSRQIIEEAAKARVPAITPGQIGAQRRRVALETRSRKVPIAADRLDAVWASRATAAGFHPAAVMAAVADNLHAKALRLARDMAETLAHARQMAADMAGTVSRIMRVGLDHGIRRAMGQRPEQVQPRQPAAPRPKQQMGQRRGMRMER